MVVVLLGVVLGEGFSKSIERALVGSSGGFVEEGVGEDEGDEEEEAQCVDEAQYLV